MVLLIILAITGYIIFGYFIMNKIDIFIEKTSLTPGQIMLTKINRREKLVIIWE